MKRIVFAAVLGSCLFSFGSRLNAQSQFVLSSSSADPFVQESAAAGGLRTLYLWQVCVGPNAGDGASDLSGRLVGAGALTPLAFTPSPEYIAYTDFPDFRLAFRDSGDCQAMGLPALAAEVLVTDQGGSLEIGPHSVEGLVSAQCGIVGDPLEVEVVGFASDGGAVPRTGITGACLTNDGWSSVFFDPSSGGAGIVGTSPLFRPVEALASFSGHLYVGGYFSGPSANIAQWDDGTSSWSSSAEFQTDDKVWDLHVHQGRLYVGGQFGTVGALSLSSNKVAAWTGTGWVSVGANSSGIGDNNVWALASSNGDLFASGRFAKTGDNLTTLNSVAVYNSVLDRWDPLIDATTGEAGVKNAGSLTDVFDMVEFGGRLVVVGSFDEAGGVPATNVAQWDGTNWSAMGLGISNVAVSNPRASLAVHNGDLLVFGIDNMSSGGVSLHEIAKWNPGSSTWSSYEDIPGPSSIGAGSSILTQSQQQLFVCGGFSVVPVPPGYPGSTYGASAVARRMAPGEFAPLGSGLGGVSPPEPVAIEFHNNAIFFAGEFQEAGLKESLNIARWDDSFAVDTPLPVAASRPAALALRVAPNPTGGATTVAFRLDVARSVAVQVYDVRGRLVAAWSHRGVAGTNRVSWDGTATAGAGRVAPGVYLVRVLAGDSAGASRVAIVR